MRTTTLPPLAVALSYVDCINRGDLDGLKRLMTDDHRLEVLDEEPVVGKEANVEAWRGYMASFPEYVIYPERLAERGDDVLIVGATTGSHLGLPDDHERKLSVLWLATARNGQLVAWRIVPDTPKRRAAFGVGG